ncbi:MAG: hypothetical protein ACQESR_29635 [Planctomycetota bacterium]
MIAGTSPARLLLAFGVLVAACNWPQPAPAQLEPALIAHGPNPTQPSEQSAWPAPHENTSTLDLSQLSDAQLLELYANTYRQSLPSMLADETAMVEASRFLLQMGYTYTHDRHGGTENTTHTIPELRLRYRIGERLELRLGWAGVVQDRLKDETTGITDWDTRVSDPSIGARWALGRQKGWVPRTSITVASPLDVDFDARLADCFDPFLGLGYTWRYGRSWCVSGQSAAVWTQELDDRYLDFQQTVSVDYLLGRRWDVFGQWSSIYPEGSRLERSSQSLGPGLAYSVTRDLQCEGMVLLGLHEPSPDVLVQFLVSWRL